VDRSATRRIPRARPQGRRRRPDGQHAADLQRPHHDVNVTPLRRLTNAEYVNTVSDLLGDISTLNLDFAGELTTEGFPFLNNAARSRRRPSWRTST